MQEIDRGTKYAWEEITAFAQIRNTFLQVLHGRRITLHKQFLHQQPTFRVSVYPDLVT